MNFDCDLFYVADRVALLGDGRVACRISVGGRTTEARHVAAGWELLQSVAG